MIVAPSLLAADASALKEELAVIQEAKWLHIDVMDGHFVPNLSFGPVVISALRPHTSMVFDTHLMVANPARLIDQYIKAGSDQITFHVEIEGDIQGLIHTIKAAHKKVGLALKPGTPVEAVIPYVDSLDLVLVMSVEPGFGGQTFITSALEKLTALKTYKTTHHLDYLISVDGGVTLDNKARILESGADVLVAGSAIFKTAHPAQTFKAFYED